MTGLRARPTRAAIPALALVLLGLHGLPAAYAKALTRDDPTGDVTKVTINNDGSETVGATTDDPEGDIDTVWVSHGDTAITVSTTMRELGSDHEAMALWVKFVTNEKVRRWAVVAMNADDPEGQHVLIGQKTQPKSCPGLSHTVDYDNDKIVVKVPRTCLSKPTWVRVNVTYVWTDDPKLRVTWQDDGYSDTYTPSADPLSARLYQ